MDFKKISLLSLVSALGLSAMLLVSTEIEAGTAININKDPDFSYDNLQTAIDEASSDDTLLLAGTFTGSFIIKEKSLVLQGESETILDGGEGGRVLEIIGISSSERINVILANKITIRNGYAFSESNNGANGGGILAVYVNLGLLQTTIENCVADGVGGGIAVLDSRINIHLTTIANNQAATGGGGSSLRSISTIKNSTIKTNRDSGGGGGGILSNNGTLSIEDVVIADNSSESVGGGLYNSTGSKAKVRKVIRDVPSGFISNKAGGDGGGIYNSGTLTVECINGFGDPLVSFIDGNISFGNGGGVYNASTATATLKCEISRNTASSGGGIYNAANESKLVVSRRLVEDNSPDNIVQQ